MNVGGFDRLTVNYYPSPGQLVFHQDRGKVPERAILAGTGGGKTFACGFEAFDITRREPANVGIIACADYPQLEVSVFPVLERLFGRPHTHLGALATWHSMKRRLDWWNGWKWRFASMDDPRSVEGITEAAFVWLNEARLIADFSGEDGTWPQLTRRLRGQAARPRYAFLDTHSPTKQIWDYFNAGNPERKAYRWGIDDAVKWGTLNAADAQRIRARTPGGSVAVRVLEGRYARASGLVYDAFNRSRHVAKWTLKPVDRWSVGVDLGWEHACVATLNAWRGSHVHTVAERVLHRPGKEGLVAAVRDLLKTYKADGTVYVGWDVRMGEYVQALQAVGLDAEEFKQHVRPSVLAMNQRLVDGGVTIDPSCKELLRQIDQYAWKKGGKEEPEKGDEDALDSWRYGVCGEDAGDAGWVL